MESAYNAIERELSEATEKIRIHVFCVNWGRGQKSKGIMFSPGNHGGRALSKLVSWKVSLPMAGVSE